MSREIVARAPTRIDLGGGWTDVPPYCEREGGFVCNVAITRYATARIFDGESRERDIASGPLVRAALGRHGITGVCVELANDFPVGAGLGGSSAASAALLGAIDAWQGARRDLSAIAEEGRRIEVEEMGIPGGRQDHYAAAYGGALALTFGENDSTAVRRIPLTDSVRSALSARSILVYTGESRVSGDTIVAVLDAYEAGDRRVLTALARMRVLAQEMAGVLGEGEIDALGGLLREHWHFQRSLHPTIPTPRIDQIVTESERAGALGAKAMGASGGGCVLIVCPEEPNARAAVERVVRPLGAIVDFEVDTGGLSVLAGAAA